MTSPGRLTVAIATLLFFQQGVFGESWLSNLTRNRGIFGSTSSDVAPLTGLQRSTHQTSADYPEPPVTLLRPVKFQTQSASFEPVFGAESNLDPSCCPEFWEHRTGLFGDFLYLTAREVDLSYATHVDGLIAASVPLAPTSVVDLDYEPSFRVGGAYAFDSCSSITVTYWYYHSAIVDGIVLPGGTGYARSETTHPNTFDVFSDSLSAKANYDIDFQIADATYKAILCRGCDYSLNYHIGLRYAHLDQQFHGEYFINGSTTVDTEVDFDGLGPRIGLEGERLLKRGFLVYGQGFASLLAGQFRASYAQQNVLVGSQANAGLDEDRLVPHLEMELGVGWQNQCGSVRLRAGYYVGVWRNTVTTPAWINGVQENNLAGVGETLAFDGLTTRVEYQF